MSPMRNGTPVKVAIGEFVFFGQVCDHFIGMEQDPYGWLFYVVSFDNQDKTMVFPAQCLVRKLNVGEIVFYRINSRLWKAESYNGAKMVEGYGCTRQEAERRVRSEL